MLKKVYESGGFVQNICFSTHIMIGVQIRKPKAFETIKVNPTLSLRILGFGCAAFAVAFEIVSKNYGKGLMLGWRRRERPREKLCTRHWEQYISTGTCQTE